MTPAQAREKAEELLGHIDPQTNEGWDVATAALARALLLAQAEVVEQCAGASRKTAELLCPWAPEKPSAAAMNMAQGIHMVRNAMVEAADALRRAAEEIK